MTDKRHLVVLTGAGISQESGLKTFRDEDGLWEGHDVMEVASIEGWQRNPALVQQFYNERRAKLAEVAPNEGHLQLARLQDEFEVSIITQNVDDLHERAGSKNVLHLHGELKYVKSTRYPYKRYYWGAKALQMGDLCPDGGQLRPDIVWFGEEVPNIERAALIVSQADVLAIIGTSLLVYPAAGLIHYAPPHCPKYYVDPKAQSIPGLLNLNVIAEKAGSGVKKMADELRNANRI